MELAIVCPGQGSQRVGMGRDIADEHPSEIGRLFSEADQLLDIPLSKLCFEGPEDALSQTENTQPAVFLVSYALYTLGSKFLPPPTVLAGHSLGEYTALVAGGSISWQEALMLVRRRGVIMAETAAQSPGGMIAVLGLPIQEVDNLCAEARRQSDESIEIANVNSPDQTVVGGTFAGLAAFKEAFESRGSSDGRLVSLGVSAPFHTSLLDSAAAEFQTILEASSISRPEVPVVSSVDGSLMTTEAQVRASLERQISRPVQWLDAMERMDQLGVTDFVEIGPGRVLSGLIRTSLPEASVHSLSDLRRLRAVESTFATSRLATSATAEVASAEVATGGS